MKKLITFLILSLICASATSAQADKYRINPYISTATFRLDHAVGFSSGFIRDFSGEVDIDEKKGKLKSIKLELNMDSVDTFNEKRDAMLKKEGFFDTGNHPKVIMKSKKIMEDTIEFETLAKGQKKLITMQYMFLGFTNDVNIARRKAVVALSGTVKRTELGVTHNVQDEAGQNLLGDDLHLIFELQAIN